MTEDQKSYRQIFKATSIFGGVQVFNILISIIRSKFVAVLIGPKGMGILNLFTTTIGFISGLTNFGLSTSSIKNVALASASGDSNKVGLIIGVLKKLLWATGILGMVLTIILSPLLSKMVFGNGEYKLGFIWVSLSLLFQQLGSGKLVILQGLRKLKYLAKANLFGASVGLLITIPLYYLWRIDGVVPVIIISSLISMLVAHKYAAKCKVPSIQVKNEDIIREGKDMLNMGFMINLNGLIAIGVTFLISIYIRNTGGVEQVGLYNAGFAILNSYVSMIFTAMYTDYYPRLAAVASSNENATLLINQEAEVAILLIAPILALFIVFVNWAVILLYSRDFVAINEMIQWAALGMYFKVASWSVATIFLAKGAAKLFFWNGLAQTLYTLVLNIIGYRIMGLEGLGVSFLLSFLIYATQVYLVAKNKYDFSFQKQFFKIAFFQLFMGLSCLLMIRLLVSPWNYFLGSFLIIASGLISIKKLDRRIDILSMIKNKIHCQELNHL